MTASMSSVAGHSVHVVGSNPALRRGVADYLRLLYPTNAISEAAPAATLEALPTTSWHYIVLDLESTADLGILPQLRAARPGMPVLVLGVSGRGASAQAVRAAGAAGYLAKASAADLWEKAFVAVAAGSTYYAADAE